MDGDTTDETAIGPERDGHGSDAARTRDTLSSRESLSNRLRSSSSPALLGLVVGNLLPLAGVLVLGWNLHELLVLYWLESAVVGAWNVPKIALAHGAETDESRRDAKSIKSNGRTVTLPAAPESIPDRPTIRPVNRGVVRFFLGNYGVFWLVHGLFVFLLPRMAPGMGYVSLGSLPTIGIALVAMVVSHGVSFWTNFLRDGEWRTVSPGQRLNAPYGRVIVLHVTIIFGAFAISFVGAPIGALVVMVVVKLGIDLAAHLREHEQEKPRGETGHPSSGVHPSD